MRLAVVLIVALGVVRGAAADPAAPAPAVSEASLLYASVGIEGNADRFGGELGVGYGAHLAGPVRWKIGLAIDLGGHTDVEPLVAALSARAGVVIVPGPVGAYLDLAAGMASPTSGERWNVPTIAVGAGLAFGPWKGGYQHQRYLGDDGHGLPTGVHLLVLRAELRVDGDDDCSLIGQLAGVGCRQ